MKGIGIASCSVYLPRYRLNRKVISGAMGWLNPGSLPGEKAVANYDEDSLTMAVAAGMDCLRKTDRANIGGMYLASTTAPYLERESAAIIATALDLRPDIRTADFAGSLKAGTSAMLAACDSIKSGEVDSLLVCSSDCRLGKPGSSQEMGFGDGAAAVVLSNSGVIASLEGSCSVSYDFPDYRRSVADKFVRAVEERFIREEGYAKFIPEAISGLLGRCGLEAKDFAKVAYPGTNPREHTAIGRRLGFAPEQIQELLITTIGESGTASPFILLAAMLEEARPGDNLLIASYGSGAEAMCFKVTGEIEKARSGNLRKQLAAKQELTSYEQYLAFRGILPVAAAFGEEVAPTQLTLTWRERKEILSLLGSQCQRCGTPQYPAQRVCVNPDCRAVDEMGDCRFSDKRGTLFSYTADNITTSVNPPMLYGMIDFEGGGKFVFELTDCEFGSLKIGMPVEMSLRRKYFDEPRGIVGYFWKAVPVRE